MTIDDGKLIANATSGKLMAHPTTGKLLYGIDAPVGCGCPGDCGGSLYQCEYTVTWSGTSDFDGPRILPWALTNTCVGAGRLWKLSTTIAGRAVTLSLYWTGSYWRVVILAFTPFEQYALKSGSAVACDPTGSYTIDIGSTTPGATAVVS